MLEVDGRPVPRKEARLESLFLEGRLLATLGLTVPVQMTEKALRETDRWVEGRCEYSNYRRFETRARIIIPKGPVPQ